MHIIHKFENLPLDKIKVIKPFNFDNKSFFNIFYNKNQPLLIQTPKCILPYRYMLYDNKYFQIDIFFEILEFRDIIKKITDHIKDKVNIKFTQMLKGKNYIDPIMSLPNNMFKIRAKNSNVDGINVYNNNKTKIDIRNIERNDEIKAIIQIEKFIIDNDSYSFLFKIIQIKKHCVIDTYSSTMQCLFIDIDENHINLEKFERFTKMLKIGVPMMGVIQKMQLEGFEEKEIKLFSQLQNKPKASINCSPPPPPPPPPPPFCSNKSESKPPLAFLNDIKNCQFTLKKAVITEKSKKDLIKEKMMKFVDKSKHAPPTLEDILNAKANLKSNKCS